MVADAPMPTYLPLSVPQGDDQCPGLPRRLSKSASASRSTATCRRNTDRGISRRLNRLTTYQLRGSHDPTRGALSLASVLLSIGPALAGSAWEDIRPSAFGNRAIEDGANVIVFQAPYRALDQRTVPLSAEAAFKDGRKIKSITFIIDENPMPVAAAFRFGEIASALRSGSISASIRLRRCVSW